MRYFTGALQRYTRWFRTGLLALLLPLLWQAGMNSAQAQGKLNQTIGIGFQKGSGLLSILKQNGALEKALAPSGYHIRWVEFPAGPQLLEALNAGSVDFGLTGAPPPIFAQAAGIDLFYVGAEPASPETEAVIVPPASALRDVRQLKGKRVAFQKGSSANLLIVQVLTKAGLTLADIQPIYLSPADARAAFTSGSIDAWAIWDPYLAAAQKTLQARVLSDHQGLLPVNSFYEASRRLVEQAPQALSVILDQVALTGAWARSNQAQVIGMVSADLGLPTEIVSIWQQRTAYGVKPVSAEMTANQQQVADSFYRLKLIPRAVDVGSKVWQWKPAAGSGK